VKVSELIKQLLELDPDDECALCVNNHPIRCATREPTYWDGRAQFVERDHAFIPIKAGYKSGGCKISFHYDTLEDALMDNPDVELDLSGITYQDKVEERYAKQIERWKQQGYEFQEWKKNYTIAYESGQKYEPKIKLRTKITNLLKRLRIIDV
jgi:hypothetical protein